MSSLMVELVSASVPPPLLCCFFSPSCSADAPRGIDMAPTIMSQDGPSLMALVTWVTNGSGSTSSVFNFKKVPAAEEAKLIASHIQENDKNDPFCQAFNCPNPFLSKKENKNKKAKWTPQDHKLRMVKVHPAP